MSILDYMSVVVAIAATMYIAYGGYGGDRE